MKKILSAILALSMVLSMVGAFGITSSAYTIDDIPGTSIYKATFESSPVTDHISYGMGGKYGYFRTETSTTRLPAKISLVETKDSKGETTKALSGKPSITRLYATEAELEALEESKYTIKIGNAEPVKALYLEFDPTKYSNLTYTEKIHYLITVDPLTKSKRWYVISPEAEKYDYVADTNLLPGGSRNAWFAAYWDNAPYMYKEGGKGIALSENHQSPLNVSAYLGDGSAPANYADVIVKQNEEGKDEGMLIHSFDYKHDYEFLGDKENGDSFAFTFKAGGDTLRIDITNGGLIIPNFNSNSGVRVNDANKTGIIGATSAKYFLGKTDAVEGIKENETELDLMSSVVTYVKDEWHNFMIVMYLDGDYYKVFYDGKPFYYLHTDGKYYDQFALVCTDNTITRKSFSLTYYRDHTYGNNFPYIDNFQIEYIIEKIETVLVWDAISGGQAIKAVKNDLNLPLSVKVGGISYPVTWKTTNSDIITNTGKVKRGAGDETVTLTATCEGVEYPFEITVSGKGIIPEGKDSVTIDDMPGKVILSEKLDVAPSKPGVILGSSAQYGGGNFFSGGGSTNSAYMKTTTIAKDGDNSNIAFLIDPLIAYMYPTDDELAEINASEYAVTYNSKSMKGMHRVFNNQDYIITVDASGLKNWYAIDNFSEETKTYAAVTTKTNNPASGRNSWFTASGAPRVYKGDGVGADVTNVSQPYNQDLFTKLDKTMLKTDENGNYKGVISYSFKYMTQSEGSKRASGFPSFYLKGLNSFSGVFELRHDSITTTASNYVYKNGVKAALAKTDQAKSFLGKDASIDGNQTSSENMIPFATAATREEGQWVDVIVVMNLDDNYYTIYIDGKPFYALDNGVYYNRFVLEKKDDTILSAVRLQASRFSTVHGDFAYVDDVVVKYYYDNLLDVITWDSISDNQPIASVLLDLNLPKKVNFKGKEQTVTWTSSNPVVISNTGKVTRGEETVSVTLTATAGGETATYNVTVKGTSGKPTVFLVGDSLTQEYGSDSTNHPELIQGIGYYLDEYFGDNISEFINVSRPGYGTKAYYHDPRYFQQGVERFLTPGDFVLIELGTNDEAKAGTDEKVTFEDENGIQQTVSLGATKEEYREYLTKFVEDIRAKGAHPIFVMPPAVGIGAVYSEYTAYNRVMQDVASEKGIDIIDVRKSLVDYIKYLKTLDTTPANEKEGNVVPSFLSEYIHVEDKLHYNAKGAMMMTKWIAEEIYESNLPTLKSLAEYVEEDMMKPTIYTAGDSIMCDWLVKFSPQWYPYQGWGSFLQEYFDGAKINNSAQSGASTASFYYDKSLMPSRVMKTILPGDYLFVSLGINDQGHSADQKSVAAENSIDGQEHRIGASLSQYGENLQKLYVDEMKKRGINVVFVTYPTYARGFDTGSTYLDKMRQVAEANDLPVVELRYKHQEYIVDEYGYNISSGANVPEVYFEEMHVSKKAMKEKFGLSDEDISTHIGIANLGGQSGVGDATHFNIDGAKVLARLAIEALYETDDARLDDLKSLLNEDRLYLKEEVLVTDASVTDVAGGANVKATVTRNKGELHNNLVAIIGAYSGTKLITSKLVPFKYVDAIMGNYKTITKKDLNYTSYADIDCTLTGEFNENTTFKLYVWDMNLLKPISTQTIISK